MSLMMLTADGRQKDAAIPEKARKTMSWVPVRERPQAKVKMPWRKQPRRYMSRLPTTSEIVPQSRRVQPHVREYIETGLSAHVRMKGNGGGLYKVF